MLYDELDELDREFGLGERITSLECFLCGNVLFEWEVDQGYCEVCAEKYAEDLNDYGEWAFGEDE